MAITDPAEILLAHDRWATAHMLRASEGLNDEQFHQKFDMGLGSLHDTLTHVIDAMCAWGHLLADLPIDPTFEKKNRSPRELLELHEQVADEFARVVHAQPLDGMVTGERGGRSYTFARGGVLTHVTTHGMHHRAQCLNMLRQLGVDPLPKTSVVEWVLTSDGEAS